MRRIAGCLLLSMLPASFSVTVGSVPSARAAEPAARSSDKNAAALFRQLDVNKDGQLTNDEASGDKERLFKRLVRTSDKDGNGQLGIDEFSAGLSGEQPVAAAAPENPPEKVARPAKPGAVFRRLDANGDGKIVRDEMPEQRREAFSQMLMRADTNQDSALSQKEFAALKPRTASPAGPERAETQIAPQGNIDRLVQTALGKDQNGDSRLSYREAPQNLQKDFVEIDTNRDGQLDAQELKARIASAQKKQRAKPDKLKKSNKAPK